MMKYLFNYFARLGDAFERRWSRFWFVPSDPTTLSAIRLLTGLVVVYWHATLSFDLVAFFGPQGLLPAADILPLEGGAFSYLNYLSTPGELWTVHLLGLAVLMMFAAGFWTRTTSILALIVFLSDVNRAQLITGRTEPIVAMLMCYLCLAPCGRRFSLDSWLARPSASTVLLGISTSNLSTSATIATRLIQVHLAMWIAMMGFSKLSGETWWSGTGMWWLMARPESRLVDFTFLHSTPKIIDFWTHALVLFELTFPLLIWIPLARPLLLALAVVLWSLLALVTGDFSFALVMMIASMAFIPPALLKVCCPRIGKSSAG